MEKIKFHWLKSGYCLHPKKVTIKNASFKVIEYPSFFGVIKHDSLGVILYDTGYSENFFEATKTFPEKLYGVLTPVFCKSNDTCAFQLKDRGIDPDDVKIVVISHFHADHICGLKHFKNAKFYFFHSGLEFLQSLNRFQQVKNGYLKGLLPDDFFKRIVKIETCKKISLPSSLAPFETGFDLIDDHNLIAVALPGHMQGHTGLYFKTDNKEVFIVGDAVWHLESIREKILPHMITKILITDWKVFSKTIHDLHDLQKRNPELIILPSHCTENSETFL